MHRGRSIGWTGEIEWPPQGGLESGRHRREDAGEPPVSRVEVRFEAPEPPPDAASARGLNKFNLGMVPASVTPPKSWRTAAWFAVGASVAVLCGLLLITSELTARRPPAVPDLPSMPRGSYYPALQEHETPQPAPPPVRSPAPASPEPTPTGDTDLPLGLESSEPGPTPPPAPGLVGMAPGPGLPQTAAPADLAPAPQAEPRPSTLPESHLVRDHAELYLSYLEKGDLRGAYELTAGALRSAGFDAFVSHVGRSELEILEMDVAPGRTLATLRITEPDGSTTTQRRELRVAEDDRVLIGADEPLR